jgi:hypothetical protein
LVTPIGLAPPASPNPNIPLGDQKDNVEQNRLLPERHQKEGMEKYKIAVLDDYQNAALESADWSLLRDRADITIFQNHLADPEAVIERLLPF